MINVSNFQWIQKKKAIKINLKQKNRAYEKMMRYFKSRLNCYFQKKIPTSQHQRRIKLIQIELIRSRNNINSRVSEYIDIVEIYKFNIDQSSFIITNLYIHDYDSFCSQKK